MRFAESSSASSIGRPSRDFGEHPLELAARRLGRLLGDRLEALHEREAGAHRARRAGSACRAAGARTCGRRFAASAMEHADGITARDRGEDQRQAGRKHQEAEDRGSTKTTGEVEEERLGRAERQVGLLERVLDAGRAAPARSARRPVKPTMPLHRPRSRRALGSAVASGSTPRRVGALAAPKSADALLELAPAVARHEEQRQRRSASTRGRDEHGEDDAASCRRRHRRCDVGRAHRSAADVAANGSPVNSAGSSEMPWFGEALGERRADARCSSGDRGTGPSSSMPMP